MRLREVFVTIKIKINSRFLFCREGEDERHKACLCWKGYVHIGRKTAHFETMHIQEPVRAEVLLFQVNMYPVPSTLLHALIAGSQMFSSFKCLKLCLQIIHWCRRRH
jgi:hypothetical protein